MYLVMLYVLFLVPLELNSIGRLLHLLLLLLVTEYLYRALVGPPLLPEGPGS